MRSTRFWICSVSFTILLLTGALYAWAQGRKPGLWDVTSTMTLQQSPFPTGMQPPPNSPLAGGPHTTQICLTQAILDKYGAPVPQSRSADCQYGAIQKTEHGMTGEMTCSGRMTGKGTVESSWTDAEHATGTVHFTGTVQAGQNSRPIEWTTQSSSVFKSADCGDVKPIAIPEK